MAKTPAKRKPAAAAAAVKKKPAAPPAPPKTPPSPPVAPATTAPLPKPVPLVPFVQVQPNLPAFPAGVFYINYFDGITDAKVRGLMALFSDILAKVKPTPATIYMTLSSPGGSVDAGITFYNFLTGLPVDLIIHNIGSVDSIATVIFLAARKRYACAHSRFLFHGVMSEFGAGTRLTTAQILEVANRLSQDERRIKELVVANSKLSEMEMLALFQQGETKDAAFALEKGIIDDIRDFALPAGAQIVTANFQ